MRARDGAWRAVALAALACGSATATAQQEPFVGQPGTVLVRPAIRWDFFGGPDSGAIKPYRDGTRDAQLLLGFDAIQKF